jgi:hypothetical protein
MVVSDPVPKASSHTTRQRLLQRLRSAPHGRFRRRAAEVTLAELEDSRRPLLFSLLPRMLRADGSTPKSLQTAFGYIDQAHEQDSAVPVSRQRWSRALATSRRLASRRSARRPR